MEGSLRQMKMETAEALTAIRSTLSRRRVVHRLVAAAAGATGTALAVACGRAGGGPAGEGMPAPAKGTVTIRFATWASGAQAEMKERQLEAFNQAQSGIKAVLESTSTSGEYWTKMQTQFAASPEDVPEVFWQSGSYFLQFSASGWHLDLGPYVKRDKFDLTKHNRQLEVEEYQGKLYALPYGTGGVVMYYNKSLFDAAGVRYPTETWTWDDVRAAAQKLTRPGAAETGGQWGFVAYPNAGETGYLPFVYANGGAQLNKERTRVLLDQPQTIAAFEWLTDNIYKHRIMPRPGELRRAPGQNDDFMTGKVAMFIGGTWRLSDYMPMQDFQWDMAHVPLSPTTRKRGTTFNENPVSIPRFTRVPEAAWALAKFLNEEKAQKIMGESKRKAPTLKTAVSDPNGFLKPPPANIRVAADLYAYAQALPFVACPAAMNEAINPELNAIYNGTKPPAEALRAATQAGNAVLAANKCS
jgi:multiple sugar transport system substrate-binding protein